MELIPSDLHLFCVNIPHLCGLLDLRRGNNGHVSTHGNKLEAERQALERIERQVPPGADLSRVADEAHHVRAEREQLGADVADASDQQVRREQHDRLAQHVHERGYVHQRAATAEFLKVPAVATNTKIIEFFLNFSNLLT